MAERVLLRSSMSHHDSVYYGLQGKQPPSLLEAQSDLKAAKATILIASMPIHNAFHKTIASPVFQWPSSTTKPTDVLSVLSLPLMLRFLGYPRPLQLHKLRSKMVLHTWL